MTNTNIMNKVRETRTTSIEAVMVKLDLNIGVDSFERATGMDTTHDSNLHHDIRELGEIMACEDRDVLDTLSLNILEAHLHDTMTGNWVVGSPLDSDFR